MQNVIVLFGKPGAGKGTRLSEFLLGCREEQFEVLAVSNLLKKARKENPEVAHYMDSGVLVPDEIINSIVIQEILSSKKTVITDGFPRTIGQAKAMIEAGIRPNKIIHLDVEDEIILQRAKDRLVCENCREIYTTNNFKPSKKEGICDKCGGKLLRRADDDEEIVKKRLEVYEAETLPVLHFLSSKNIKICTMFNARDHSSKQFEELLLN